MTPYYERDGITLYHADCRELLATMPAGSVDAVVTDPPYGMNLDTDFSGFSGWSGKGIVYKPIHGDNERFDPSPFLIGKRHVFWGAQYFCHSLPEAGGWMVFNKRGNGEPSAICFGDCELAWCDAIQSVRMYSQMWHGVSRWSTEGRLHPTQKPVGLMEWCIEQSRTSGEILDPFAGSCTTGVAAWNLGRKAVLCEISEEYCELGAKRLDRVISQGRLFKPEPVRETQGTLFEENTLD